MSLHEMQEETKMSKQVSTAPSLAVAARICSSDNAHAAQAATYRYESRCRELVERFEAEMEKIRSAYL
jgi:hypothetical protein